MQKLYIRYAYKAGVCAITSHSNLISQISEDGSYWNAIENATKKDKIFNCNESLSEVLLDSTIKEVVCLMFGVDKDPYTWSDSIKRYAFGE